METGESEIQDPPGPVKVAFFVVIGVEFFFLFFSYQVTLKLRDPFAFESCVLGLKVSAPLGVLSFFTEMESENPSSPAALVRPDDIKYGGSGGQMA